MFPQTEEPENQSIPGDTLSSIVCDLQNAVHGLHQVKQDVVGMRKRFSNIPLPTDDMPSTPPNASPADLYGQLCEIVREINGTARIMSAAMEDL